MAQVKEELRKQNVDAAEWIEPDGTGPEFERDEEDFVDEDKYTTVTVEPMGESADSNEDDEKPVNGTVKPTDGRNNTAAPKEKLQSKYTKAASKKKKKFRYESKAERAATRSKQKSKNHAAKIRRTGG